MLVFGTHDIGMEVKMVRLLVCFLFALLTGPTAALAATTKLKQAKAQPAVLSCNPSKFNSMAHTVHHPTERMRTSLAWLKARNSICTMEEKLYIRSNLGHWLGSALTAEIESALD